jgi:GntR family transcriptional regulator
LSPGEELPSIRVLAESLVVNPNTIARAYRELEQAGIVSSSRGLGTFVAEFSQSTSRSERRAVLAEKAQALVLEAHQMGVPLSELNEIVTEACNALRAINPEENHG